MKKSKLEIDDKTYEELLQIQELDSENISDFLTLVPDLNYETFSEFIKENELEDDETAGNILKQLEEKKSESIATMINYIEPSWIPTEIESKEKEPIIKIFTKELKQMYWGELALKDVSSKLIRNASSEFSLLVLNKMLHSSSRNIKRLEVIFEFQRQEVDAKEDEVLNKLIGRGESMIAEVKEEGAAKDIVVNLVGQQLTGYKVAFYDTLFSLARSLNLATDIILILNRLKKEADDDDVTLEDFEEVH